MSTTYILAGGYDSSKSETEYDGYGQKVARVVLDRVTNPRVLHCLFANDSLSDEKHIAINGWFRRNFHLDEFEEVKLETFYEQAVNADVIYLHGGSSRKYIDLLPDFERSKAVFAGKIVIGTSAGANYLASFGYSPRADKVLRGSGAVDAAILVHYGGKGRTSDEWAEYAQRVRNESGRRDILCIGEGEFIVVEA